MTMSFQVLYDFEQEYSDNINFMYGILPVFITYHKGLPINADAVLLSAFSGMCTTITK